MGGGIQEGKLSAHERQQEKTKRRIEQLEKSNLESKDWTMQGEVMAARLVCMGFLRTLFFELMFSKA